MAADGLFEDADGVLTFAGRRIGRVMHLLGEEEVNRAIDGVYEEFGQRQDSGLWDIYLNGDRQQWMAVSKEFERGFSEEC